MGQPRQRLGYGLEERGNVVRFLEGEDLFLLYITGVGPILYASPNIFRVIKSKSMSWVGSAVSIAEMKKARNILTEKTEGNGYL
jgi:hypothetical protein